MKIYDYNDKKLVICGSINSDFNTFFNSLIRNLPERIEKKKRVSRISNDYSNSVVVVCGDNGFGFENIKHYYEIFDRNQQVLKLNNTVVLFIRGNHDDPSYFSEEKINYENIKTIPDYSVLITKDFTSLCIGGGISYDRSWRVKREALTNKYKQDQTKFKKLYWEDEGISFNEEIIDSINKNDNILIDNLITHMPLNQGKHPQSSYISWTKIDESLSNDFKSQTDILTNVFNLINKRDNIKTVVSGHLRNYDIFKTNNEKLLNICVSPNFGLESLKRIIDNNSRKDSDKINWSDLYSEFKHQPTTLNFEEMLREYNERREMELNAPLEPEALGIINDANDRVRANNNHYMHINIRHNDEDEFDDANLFGGDEEEQFEGNDDNF